MRVLEKIFLIIIIIIIILFKISNNYYVYLIILLSIINLVIAIKKRGVISIISFFLIMSYLYIYLRIYIYFIIGRNLGETSWYYPIVVGASTVNFSLKLVLLNTIGILFCLNSLKKRKVKQNRNLINREDTFFYKISYIIYMITYFSLYIKLFYDYQYVKFLGYAEGLYGGGISSNVPIVIRVFFNLNWIFFYFFLSTNKKRYKLLVLNLNLIYVVINTILLGGRAIAILYILFYIWYLYKVLKIKKIKYYSWILLIPAFCYGIFIVIKRSGNINILEALWLQSETFAQLNYLKEFFEATIKEYGFLNIYLTPILYIFREYSQFTFSAFEIIKKYSIYGSQLGVGIGGNYIVDMYVLGREFGIIIFSFLLVKFFLYIEKYIENTKFISLKKIVILNLIANYTFNLSRQGLLYFINVNSILKCTVIYILLKIIYKNIIRKESAK